MPASAEAEQALPRFVDSLKSDQTIRDRFNLTTDIETLRQVVQSVDA